MASDITNELERLEGLKERGALSEEEFQRAKETLLANAKPMSQKINATLSNMTSDANTWGMLIHLSQFCGYLIPLAGLVVPIVLWQLMKKDSPAIDRHGRIVTNWIISAMIYLAVFTALSTIFIGIPFLIALGIVGIVFPIVGGVKANKGEFWEYPLSIKFFILEPLDETP